MVNSYSCSSFCTPNYQLLKRDELMNKITFLRTQTSDGLMRRNIASSKTQTTGSIAPLQATGRQIHSILNQGQCKKPFRIFSSLADDVKHSEGLITTNDIPVTIQNGNLSKSKDDNNITSSQNVLTKQLNALYQFSRPHTVIGTVIGITSVSLLPVETIAELTPRFFMGLLKALVPSVLMNIYIVGLNQLYDVEIDKVNKPYLPLASGDFSMGTGKAIVYTSLLISLAMGVLFQSPPLFTALLVGCLLGSVYSIDHPLLRWKRNAVLAASCILIVRAIIVQFAFYEHIQKYVLGKPLVITRPLIFGVTFMCFFSAVIALFKDIPDVDGDKTFGIQSFTVSLGQERVFWLCVKMLLVAYGAAVTVGVSSSFLSSKLITILGHCTLASILWLQARSVDLTSKASITSFYMFIWKLFYAEYFLIPFVR